LSMNSITSIGVAAPASPLEIAIVLPPLKFAHRGSFRPPSTQWLAARHEARSASFE
jgi:hypothetical protein